MHRLLALCTASILMSSPAAAQQPAAQVQLLEHLAGRWVLRGTIDNTETTHDVDAQFVLNRGYLRLHEVSHEKDSRGAPAYEAIVFISVDTVSGEYACLWLDNTGSSAFDPAGTGRGAVAGDSVPFVFHYTPRTSFHTTFVYSRAADSWQWHMDNDSAGVRRPFARVTLTRR